MTPSLLLRELLDWRVYPDVLVLAVMAFLRYRTLRAMGTWKIALGQGMEVGGGGGAGRVLAKNRRETGPHSGSPWVSGNRPPRAEQRGTD